MTALAGKMEMPNLIHLERLVGNDDYIALVFKEFKMDLREYLREHRNPKIIQLILEQMIDGVE